MELVVVYKKVLNPLYPFEQGNDTYLVNYPSKIVVKEDALYEIDLLHLHDWFICKTEQLVEIVFRN